ncbi:MAG: sulfotransferase family 2 domain-containing protein [Steroidobacteraceae bacterium]
MTASLPPRHEPAPSAVAGVTRPFRLQGLGHAGRILKQPHFSPFKLFVDREHRTVVVLNPKVGTRTLRDGLARGVCKFRGCSDASQGRYRLFSSARKFPCASPHDYWHAISHADEYAFYAFVRNPYGRVRSAWLDKLAFGHMTGYPRSTRRRVIGPLRRLARQRGLSGGAPASAVSFSTFLSYIEAEPAGRRDHHWDEQHAVLMMDVLRYTRVFRLETQFREGLAEIFTRIGFASDWVDELVASRRNQSTKLPEPVFDADLARRTQAIYARDFAELGYAEDSWRGL